MTIPNGKKRIARLGARAAVAAVEIGAAVGLLHNTGPVMVADVQEYVGSLGLDGDDAPVIIGKQGELNQANADLADAQVEYTAKVIQGRAFCDKVVGILKNDFGKRWNAKWQAVGFTAGSLAQPTDPMPLLLELRAFYRTHPEQEVGQINVTAGAADAEIRSILAAHRAFDSRKATRTRALAARDVACRKVQQRLSALQEELSRLLGPADDRWYEFGFKRPVDGNLPDRVEELVLRMGGIPGEVIAEWEPSSLAENYRVTKQVRDVDSEPVMVALVSDNDANIHGLPSGATVVIRVSARNSAGETLATEASITMP